MKKHLIILLSNACFLGFALSGHSQTSWNAYNDFYFDSTNYANNSPGTPIPWPTKPSATGQAWGYYDANINGYGGYPTNIGSYFGAGGNTTAGEVLQGMAIYQPLGSGQGQIGGGVPGSTDGWDATGGTGFARYGDNAGFGSVLGEYGGAWYSGGPGYGTSYAGQGGLFLQPGFLGVPFSDGIANVVTWTAPSDGTYTFTGSFLIAGNNPGNAYAVVDSKGGIELPRAVGVSGTLNSFSFTNTYHAGDVVEFQVGTAGQPAAAVGFNCSIQLVQITDWNAYDDFYFDSTNYADNSPAVYIPWPQTPSITGKAWGYYDCNINGNGYPGSIGTYFPPGGNYVINQVLYAMSDYQPLGPGEGQLGGGVPGSQDAWDATGGSGYARYSDSAGWGTVLGEYGGAWYSCAPGDGTAHASDTGLYLQPIYLGNGTNEGIGNVITWTAPSDGTYTFSGSFLIGDCGGQNGSDYAIVDSEGRVEIPRTQAALGSYNTFSFTKTLKARDNVEFQVGNGTNGQGAAVGFNCNVQLVQITDWNAFNDFYFDSSNYANHNPAAYMDYATVPSLNTGTAWGYYDANCNYSGGYPGSIGAYFGPGNNTSLGQVLLAMSNYQPLGVGQGQVAGGVGTSADAWDATGGTGFARYVDDNGWGTSLGAYGGAWFAAAPGEGTPYASDTGIWMQAGWLNGTSAQGEGICPVVTWTAPKTTTFTFNGSFLIGNNGTSGPDGANCDYAIVDSLGGIEVPKTVVPQGTYNTFTFQKALNAGDVVEFQVGTDNQVGAAVGFNCDITDNPVPAVLISATRSLANSEQVSVQFNAPLYAPSVVNLANYSLNNGATITSAQLSPTDPTTVILTVNPGLDYSATLTVNGVESSFGQLPVATNSTALITVPLYLPSGLNTPTNAAQDTFSGSALGPNWISGDVYDEGNNLSESNYYFTQVFVQSNGVLHVHADNRNLNAEGFTPDPNYLIYYDPAYQGSQGSAQEEALVHLTIKASNFNPVGGAIAGVGVCVQEDPYISLPEGGDCLRAVIAGYAGVTNYPFYLACSDYVADNNTPAGIGDVYNLQWKVGQSYWLRIRQDPDTNPATDGIAGGIISTKVWLGDGSQPEPANWQSVWKDPVATVDPSAATRSGFAAIRAGWGLGTVMDFDVDYFLEKAAGLPTITPTLPASFIPQIQLGIATGGGNAVLSWPSAVQNGYTLQSRSFLTSGVWSNVSQPLVVNGIKNSVTVPLNGQSLFFRLVHSP